MKNYRYILNGLVFQLFISSAAFAVTSLTGDSAPTVTSDITEVVIPVKTAVSAYVAHDQGTINHVDTAVQEMRVVPVGTAVLEETASAGTASYTDSAIFQEAVNQILPKNNRRIGEIDGGETIYGKRFILRMYDENDNRPLWDPISIQSLSDALHGLAADGLNPGEYRFVEIEPYLNNPSHTPQSAGEVARIDILLTESYLRALYNLDYGKVDPERLDADHNFASVRDDKDRSSLFLSWVKKGRVDEAFNWARPKSDSYKSLKNALARYQKIMEAGGWPIIPNDGIIKPEKSDSRISLVMERLAITGDTVSATGQDMVDEELDLGIRKFQERHHLKVDGKIGRNTLAAMNVPVEERIDQIRANLERQRWYFPKDLEEYLVVDVAGFQIFWIKDQEVIWQEQVQVGKRFTSTPIFRDQIEHIDFNPTWSVPPGIKKRTILPSLQLDASYLVKKGYRLLDDYGRSVDPYSIDWRSMTKIPYTVRQPPGRGNALGRVKFMFPNKHSVFLHDTNHREMFARKQRTTSSGCIRLRNPFVFAEQLLERQEGWDRDRIDGILATGRTTRIQLEKPLPILIQYGTVSVIDNEVIFRKDMYHRDAKLLAVLNAPFELHLPDLPKQTQLRIRARVKSASASVAKLLAPKPEIIGISVPNQMQQDDNQLGRFGPVAIKSLFDQDEVW